MKLNVVLFMRVVVFTLRIFFSGSADLINYIVLKFTYEK